MDARSEILARVAAANMASTVADRSPTVLSARSRAEIVDQFAEYAAEYKAKVLRVAPEGVAEAVAGLLKGRVLVASDLPLDWLALHLWPPLSQAKGEEPGPLTLVPDDGLLITELDQADTALTLCAVAVAETGTVVLDAGMGQGRRAMTLVPDHHIVVVPAERIVDSIPEAIARLAEAVWEGRPLTWISGPSATSDIELSRVEGVHGPRRLDIVIVD